MIRQPNFKTWEAKELFGWKKMLPHHSIAYHLSLKIPYHSGMFDNSFFTQNAHLDVGSTDMFRYFFVSWVLLLFILISKFIEDIGYIGRPQFVLHRLLYLTRFPAWPPFSLPIVEWRRSAMMREATFSC